MAVEFGLRSVMAVRVRMGMIWSDTVRSGDVRHGS